MNEEISLLDSLNAEILQEIEDLPLTADNGTEEHSRATEDIRKLLDLAYKIDKDHKELESCKKQDLIKNILSGAGIVVPALLYVWGAVKSLKFEETGTLTTLFGKNVFNAIHRINIKK